MKTAQVKLFRLIPPFVKTVTIGQITVGGLLDFLRQFSDHNELRFLAQEGPLLATDMMKAASAPELVTSFVDKLAIGETMGFFRSWSSQANFTRFLKAASCYGELNGPNDWSRIASALNFSGERRRAGSLMGDLVGICRIMGGLTPQAILMMPMEEFLDLCEGLRAHLGQDEETEGIATAGELSTIQGLGVVH